MRMLFLHLLQVVIAGTGQTVLLVFAWCFLGKIWQRGSLALPDPVARVMIDYPSESTTIVTIIATLLSVASASFFTIAVKEAFRHRMRNPISLIQLAGGVALARGGFIINFRHIPTSLVTIAMFALTKIMVSSWATLLAPTTVAYNVTATGSELDLSSSYFESQLSNQLLSNGNAIPARDTAIEVIDIDALLSGIATVQQSFGIRQVLDFNGALYNASTGGIIPVIRGYSGRGQQVESSRTGLNFVGGVIPSSLRFPTSMDQARVSNFSVVQQGLSADVNCFQVSGPQEAGVTIDNGTASVLDSTGNGTTLFTPAYSMACTEGNPAHQDYVVRSFNGSTSAAASIVASLVCPYPIRQSQLDWTQFNVTTLGSGRYSFLQSTICEITPTVTTSFVTYAHQTLNAIVVNQTALTSINANLALFLASMVDYQSRNAQGLASNSMGDALYSIAASVGTNMSDSGPMDADLIHALEDYWRGIIEFTGTYLRSGFSANGTQAIPNDGLVNINGTQIITTKGWTKRSPLYLYIILTILPLTSFALLTYVVIGYVLWQTCAEYARKTEFTTFDATNPIHLIMGSSTREQEGGWKGERVDNLKGEAMCGFREPDIQNNETLVVLLDNVESKDNQLRKRFRLVSSPMITPTVSKEHGSQGTGSDHEDSVVAPATVMDYEGRYSRC